MTINQILENSSLRKEMEKLWKFTKGKVRAETIKNHFQCIEAMEGKEGLIKVQNKLEELGHPIRDLKKFSPLEFVPTALADSVVLVATYVFHWTDRDIFQMGNSAPKFSFIVRLLMKTFLSLRKVFEEAPKYWQEHFTEGRVEAAVFNAKEKYLILRLYHWCHPVMCVFYAGYFLRIGQYVIRSKNVAIKETKCMNRGDPYHEFLIHWES
ncbi:hypothetical protein J7J81_01270 [bacterium]|nr:hypothetical protein [bacterium]